MSDKNKNYLLWYKCTTLSLKENVHCPDSLTLCGIHFIWISYDPIYLLEKMPLAQWFPSSLSFSILL